MFLSGLVLLVCVWSPVEPACDPVEEGQTTTLTCAADTTGCSFVPYILWQAETGSEVIPVATCVEDLNDRTICKNHVPDKMIAPNYPNSSTMTIYSVSRAVPFNMETKWSCNQCGYSKRYSRLITACDKLEIYAKPTSPSCTVTENLRSGEIMSVTVTCSTHKVYPEAKCSFYTIKNGGNPVEISKDPTYKHTENLEVTENSRSLVYYSSNCTVTVPIQDLGEGTHSFQGYLYPDVTGGQSLVTGITPDKTVTLIIEYRTITEKGAGGESQNIPAIVLGVILVTLVVIIFFLVRRNRTLTKGKVTDLYLVPIDTPDIVNNLQNPEIPAPPGQVRDVMEIGFSPILTGGPPVASHVKVTNDMSPETNYYETLPDMTPTSGPYNSTSPQDVEPPNIYRRPIPDTSSTRHDAPSGDYINIS